MKALIYHSAADIRLEDVEQPRPDAGELIVRVAGCGLCGSDLVKIARDAPPPVILGHELAGRVVAAGEGAPLAVGTRVTVAHHVPCGQCHFCRHGNESMCASFKSSNISPSGFAEYIRVSARHSAETTFALPNTMSYETASFVEPLGCAVRAVRRSALGSGDVAVVYGMGTVGMLLARAAAARGAVPIGVDVLPERVEWAMSQGVTACLATETEVAKRVRERTAGRGADVAFITAGGSLAMSEAIGLLRPGGSVHIFAASPVQVTALDVGALYSRELMVTATYSSSPADLRAAFDLLAAGIASVEGFISHRLPLERFAEGVELFAGHSARKVYFEIAPDA
jgi:L-iditol 2-dehydrogenase